MTERGKISTRQMFAIMFLIRVIALFTFMLPSDSYLQSGDRVIVTFPVMIFEFIFLLIAVFVLKKSENEGLIKYSCRLSPFIGRVISVIYALGFIWFAGIGVARFELFISTVMFPNSELYIMAVLLILSAVFASLKGIEAIGRASGILIVILTACILFVVLTVSDDFEYTNLKPILTKGIPPVIKFSFYISMRTVELLTLYVTAPKIKGNIFKMASLWITAFGLLTVGIITLLSGVTGEYGDDQIFQLYTLTVIAKLGIFERLDDILTGIWVLCSFILAAFLIYTATLSLKQAFGEIKKLPVSILSGAGIFAVYYFTSGTVTGFTKIVGSSFQNILFITLMVILPLTVTTLNLIKERRKNRC